MHSFKTMNWNQFHFLAITYFFPNIVMLDIWWCDPFSSHISETSLNPTLVVGGMRGELQPSVFQTRFFLQFTKIFFPTPHRFRHFPKYVCHEQKCKIFILDKQGRRNRFSLGGARIIRKMSFCEFSKILLSKCSILGGARAPPAPPVPPPLVIIIKYIYTYL